MEAEQIDDEALTGVKDLRGSFIFVLHRFSISLVESLSLTLFDECLSLRLDIPYSTLLVCGGELNWKYKGV